MNCFLYCDPLTPRHMVSLWWYNVFYVYISVFFTNDEYKIYHVAKFITGHLLHIYNIFQLFLITLYSLFSSFIFSTQTMMGNSTSKHKYIYILPNIHQHQMTCTKRVIWFLMHHILLYSHYYISNMYPLIMPALTPFDHITLLNTL